MAGVTTLNFKDWIRQNPSIPFALQSEKYEEYIRSQTLQQIQESSETRNQLRDTYIAYLKRLTVFYEDDPEIRQLQNLDFEDDIQLCAAIPIFARKLKDVAIYAQRKREELKQKKQEYSTKGSKKGLVVSLKNYILDEYSSDIDYINPNINQIEVINSLRPRKELANDIEICCDEKYNLDTDHDRF